MLDVGSHDHKAIFFAADGDTHRLILRNIDIYIETEDMAPLSVNDRVNLSASVGTWLGSLFTAIGLIAVLSQLRAIMVSNRTRQDRFISRAAGIWSSCFNRQALQTEGTIEQAAPAMGGWIQRQYLNKWATKVMQSDTKKAGTSSWSKLFAQCSIAPSELIECGGPNSLVLTATSRPSSRTPTQADIRIEDGRLEYGFSSTEFAALLIVAGLSSDAFTAKGTSSSTGYVGTMYLADHGPFTQIAHFDPHAGTRVMEVELTRLVHDVPIQGAIHLALGILKLSPKIGDREWIILPSHLPRAEDDTGTAPPRTRVWTELPRTSQLHELRYNIEQLALVSGGDMITYSSRSTTFAKREETVMEEILERCGMGVLSEQNAMLGAYAIDALRPWALLPVAPKHFLDGFAALLAPFVASREETLGLLSQRLRHLPSESPFASPKSGWEDVGDRIDSLNRIGDIKTEYFCRSSNYCAYYFEAMTKVFHHAGLSYQTVRRRLAAEVALQIQFSEPVYPDPKHGRDENMEKRGNFISEIMSHLSGRSPSSTAEAAKHHYYTSSDAFRGTEEIHWAVKIYATYLWGWLHDRKETDGNFMGKFRRRIFLG